MTTPAAATWPPDRFFWAVLEAPGVKPGLMPAGLAPILQDEVPIDADTLHAIVTPLDGAHVLACAVRTTDLAQLPPGTLSLRPAQLPSFISNPTSIPPPELLIGPHEPLPLRRERRRRWSIALASILLASGLLSAGLLRRASALNDHAHAAHTRAAAVLSATTGDGRAESLAREVARLQSLSAANRPASPPDAALAIAALLRTWPAGVDCEASVVSINAATMALTLSVPGDARPLLDALKTPDGWTLDEPRLSTIADRTRISLTLKRRPGGGA